MASPSPPPNPGAAVCLPDRNCQIHPPKKKPLEPPQRILGKGLKPRRPGKDQPPPQGGHLGGRPALRHHHGNSGTRPSARRRGRREGAWWRHRGAPGERAVTQKGCAGAERGRRRWGKRYRSLPLLFLQRGPETGGSAGGGERGGAWPARTCSSPVSCWWVRSGGSSPGRRPSEPGGPCPQRVVPSRFGLGGGGFLVKPSALSRPCAKVGQREPQQERRAGGAA